MPRQVHPPAGAREQPGDLEGAWPARFITVANLAQGGGALIDRVARKAMPWAVVVARGNRLVIALTGAYADIFMATYGYPWSYPRATVDRFVEVERARRVLRQGEGRYQQMAALSIVRKVRHPRMTLSALRGRALPGALRYLDDAQPDRFVVISDHHRVTSVLTGRWLAKQLLANINQVQVGMLNAAAGSLLPRGNSRRANPLSRDFILNLPRPFNEPYARIGRRRPPTSIELPVVPAGIPPSQLGPSAPDGRHYTFEPVTSSWQHDLRALIDDP